MSRVTVEFLLMGQQLHSRHDAPLQRHGTYKNNTMGLKRSFAAVEANWGLVVLIEFCFMWHMPKIPALRKQRPKDHEFQAMWATN